VLVRTNDEFDERLVSRQRRVLVGEEPVRGVVDDQQIQLASTASDHVHHSLVLIQLHVHAIHLTWSLMQSRHAEYTSAEGDSQAECTLVGGVAQWLGRRSLADGLSLIHA